MEPPTPPRAAQDVGCLERATVSSWPRSRRSAHVALEDRIAVLEQLSTAQGHELKIQFQRIAQLQAECDMLRIRFTTTTRLCTPLLSTSETAPRFSSPDKGARR
jgi:hypothetical protein